MNFEDSIKGIRRGMPLFLFNTTNKCLYGIFEVSPFDPCGWQSFVVGEITRKLGAFEEIKKKLGGISKYSFFLLFRS